MGYIDDDGLKALVGRTVTALWMDEDHLTFEVDGHDLIGYEVEGDCCSHSYFYDFYGVQHLLENGPVVAVESVELQPGDPGYYSADDDADPWGEVIDVYGYRITTEHPTFGPVSSVFSFRNANNGYYGGWLVGPVSSVSKQGDRLLTDKVGE